MEEEKYGKLEGTLSTLPIAVMGMLMVGIAFLIASVALIYFTAQGGGNLVAMIICIIIAVVVLAYVFYVLLKCKVFLYEKGIVITSVGKKEEIPLEDISCIFWDFPGASQVNSRGPRKNVTTAEIIRSGHQKSIKISDGYYGDVEAKLGSWQTEHKIPRDL